MLNADSLWRRAPWPALLGGLVVYPFAPARAIARSLDRPGEAIARWDALLRRRDAAGVAGVDAHGFPSYENLFRVLRNHVLLAAPLSGEAARDAAAVHEALARGRSYMAVEALAPAGGFFFHAARGDDRWQMGDTVAPAPDLVLRAGGRLPRGARVELYRNGARVATGEGGIELAAPEPGAYRVEVRVAGSDVPWILSNRSTSTAGWRRSSAPAGPAGRRPRPRRRRSHGPWTRSGTGRPWPPSRTRTRGSIPTCGSRASASRAPPAGSASACASRARTPRRSGARSWTGRGGTCRETRGWSST